MSWIATRTGTLPTQPTDGRLQACATAWRSCCKALPTWQLFEESWKIGDCQPPRFDPTITPPALLTPTSMLRFSAAVVFSLISDLGTKWQRHQTQDFQLEIRAKSSKYLQPLPQTIPNPKSFKQLLTQPPITTPPLLLGLLSQALRRLPGTLGATLHLLPLPELPQLVVEARIFLFDTLLRG